MAGRFYPASFVARSGRLGFFFLGFSPITDDNLFAFFSLPFFAFYLMDC